MFFREENGKNVPKMKDDFPKLGHGKLEEVIEKVMGSRGISKAQRV